MKRFFNVKNCIVLVILLAAGLGLALAARRGQELAWTVWAADILFSQATMVLFWGAVLLLGNAHMFTSFTYSFRQLHRLIQGRQMKGNQMKDDYLQYRESRPHHDGTAFYFIVGGILLALSLAVGLLA